MNTNKSDKIFPTHLRRTVKYLRAFLTWIIAGVILGVIGGGVGGAFSLAVKYATAYRTAHRMIIWLLPLGGLIISLLYHASGWRPTDTNGVLLALHQPKGISFSTGPIIFASASISHLLGASVGREGAALQLGGVLGYGLVRVADVRREDSEGVIMCGMSAVFAALFGTPLAAAFFAIEVASVGLVKYGAIIPCMTSSFVAVRIARLMGAGGDFFPISDAMPFVGGDILAVVAVAAVAGLVSILYCVSLRQSEKLIDRIMPNYFIRAAVGGLLIAMLTEVIGTRYNGAGMTVIEEAVQNGVALPQDFIVKLIFTVISVSAGFKGGEIVPAMFIGSTLGCVLAPLLGLDPSLGAAVGLLSMFCGSLNCPVSSILLGVELFGAANLYFFAIACAVSYMLSANFGLYKEQMIVYSKLKAKEIDLYTD